MPRRTPQGIKWDLLERTLFRLTKADLRRFAKKHPREAFYGFAFDCNSVYGEVGLCANTIQMLKAQRKASDPNAEFWASLDKKLGHRATPATKQRRSRWELGDWDHQAFNSPEFDRDWRRFQSAVANRCKGEEQDQRTFMTPTQVRFLEAVCQVLIRLEREGAFDDLHPTPNFMTLAMDHEESESMARARMRRLRRSEGEP